MNWNQIVVVHISLEERQAVWQRFLAQGFLGTLPVYFFCSEPPHVGTKRPSFPALKDVQSMCFPPLGQEAVESVLATVTGQTIA